ncbi:MAG: 1-acyl-sn-glycerol-3-phosphate acyltransferase [Deltaproteobacteria bacterium]|nr:1-acyl-sn-glycerol-3-phosphate acyltransferase [Deltaproteobacteria bacterium]
MGKRKKRVKTFAKTSLVVLLTLYYSVKAIVSFKFAMDSEIAWQSAVQWAKRLVKSTGVAFDVNGLENIERGEPCVIVANHLSAADIPTLISALPIDFRFIAKRELLSLPFLGKAMEVTGNIVVDRDDRSGGAKAMKKSITYINRGKSILIFSEGTRSKEKKIGQFKQGAFLIAKKAKIPLLPVVIWGTDVIMPKGEGVVVSTGVYVKVLEPIRPGMYMNWTVKEFSDKVRDIMAKGLLEMEYGATGVDK